MPAKRVPRSRLTRRLEPPSFAFTLVQTRVLHDLGCETARGTKVVTLAAPTGYGKTVAQSALYQRRLEAGEHCYWIALDDRDSAVERLVGLLRAGLGAQVSELDPNQDLLRGDEPLENRVDALLEQVARLPEPATIFIDNLGYCTDEGLADLLDRLVFRTPASLRLIFSSTAQIPFNHTRAKLEGLIREVGYAELSLRAAEVRELLGSELCAEIGDQGVEVVLKQTEGWPAAVRLAQILLAASENPREALARFSGTDEDIAELLNRQVLAVFTPEVRQFLLETAPLRSFCIELCREATGDEAAGQHIGLLLKRSVFIIPMDRNKSWYRLHGLFREFLEGEARRQLSEARRREVLVRAAAWCERGGHWQDAIEYALQAGSIAVATEVLERVAALFVRDRGDLRQYIEWIERLHAGGHQAGWEADFWYVWALVFLRRYDHARIQNERLAQRIAQELVETEKPDQIADLRRRTELIRICVDTYTDHQAAAHARGMHWLATTGADDPFNVATVASAAGIHLISGGQFVEAREVMRRAQTSILQANSAYGVGWVSLITAMIGLAQGDYRAVHQELLATLARARAALGEGSDISGTIALVCAKCCVEMGVDEEARELLAAGLERASTHGIADTAACGLDAAVKLWNATPAEAGSLAELREIAAGYPPRLSRMLGHFLVQRLIRLGRLDDAQTEAENVGLLLEGSERRAAPRDGEETARSQELAQAARIDLLIALGRLKPAELLIAEEIALAKRDGRYARLVELSLCEAVVAGVSHNTQLAVRHLTRAVSLAARRRIVRPFRDRAEMIAGLVNETSQKSWGFALDEERSLFAEICRGLPLGNAMLVDELGHLKGEGQLLETPTTRELELLSLVEVGLSNQQLSDRLSVSVATVKWHLYNLYTKLGVSSRSAALARARALNLLSR
ncbi:MAG: LuxR C-terminal-related transcriptional regulator [Pseudomonadota bacterium]